MGRVNKVFVSPTCAIENENKSWDLYYKKTKLYHLNKIPSDWNICGLFARRIEGRRISSETKLATSDKSPQQTTFFQRLMQTFEIKNKIPFNLLRHYFNDSFRYRRVLLNLMTIILEIILYACKLWKVNFPFH